MTTDSGQKPIFTASINDAGQRVDNFLIKKCKQLSKSNCYKLIRKGQIRINGKRIKPLQKLTDGDQIRVPPYVFFVDQQSNKIPQQLQQQILGQIIFEDDSFFAINKPAGFPCHKGTGHDYGIIEILTSILEYKDLQLAHRLDKDTSGCLLLSKNRASLLIFQKALKQKQVTKQYVAVLSGQLLESVAVNQPLDTENRVNGKRRVIVSQKGKPAETLFTPLRGIGKNTLVQCEISSGRTHQLRVHAQFIGHAVLGDEFYGKTELSTDRALFLHAHRLSFNGYQFISQIPKSFY